MGASSISDQIYKRKRKSRFNDSIMSHTYRCLVAYIATCRIQYQRTISKSINTKYNPKINILENLRFRLKQDAKTLGCYISISLQNHRQSDGKRSTEITHSYIH